MAIFGRKIVTFSLPMRLPDRLDELIYYRRLFTPLLFSTAGREFYLEPEAPPRRLSAKAWKCQFSDGANKSPPYYHQSAVNSLIRDVFQSNVCVIPLGTGTPYHPIQFSFVFFSFVITYPSWLSSIKSVIGLPVAWRFRAKPKHTAFEHIANCSITVSTKECMIIIIIN